MSIVFSRKLKNFRLDFENNKKVAYLCSPLQPEAARLISREAKKKKLFCFKFGKSESLLTFALPIAKRAKRKVKSE
jgi:hypothetical protein